MRNREKNKAFTIIELLVAMALLTVLLLVSGMVFRMAADAHRRAGATTEIMQKLRAITDQLDNDFAGLRKDAMIFIIWQAINENGRYVRHDKIVFFADGNFQSYQPDATGNVLSGNLARISYMQARPVRPSDFPGSWWQHPSAANVEPINRILARSQHILSSGQAILFPDFTRLPSSGTFDQAENLQWEWWNNSLEYDNQTLTAWKNLPLSKKQYLLPVLTDVKWSNITNVSGGLIVEGQTATNVHNLFAQGVGEFSIQSWLALDNEPPRWFPEVDPDGDGNISDTDFFLAGSVIDEENVPGLLYPHVPTSPALDAGGILSSRTISSTVGQSLWYYPRTEIDEKHFEKIPGLGRALKFTFTLYDSKGVFTDGKTFTHIVRLGD
ncbi:MAG: prepilin-type N-terminal cleavage/methylation domain-containing protein [Sedimentisphaerales bacterium]|nr:prepilin-type N-terminal cleavage/methylation domain-containing protein [Sedimentisphaerales bacterium]